VISLVHKVIDVYICILILSAILSWFPGDNGPSFLTQTKRTVASLTDPVLQPIRQFMPRPNMGGVSIDFSVWIAIILLRIINSLF